MLHAFSARLHVLQVVGSPIAAALLSLDGWLGLEGWQWLFLAEGLPTIMLGTYLNRCICDGPAKATFLTPQEREWLIERNVRPPLHRTPLLAVFMQCIMPSRQVCIM
jgi:hypothetical protein